MSRVIEIQFNEDSRDLMQRVRETALKYSWQLVGNDEQGQFSGKGIEGTYKINGNQLSMTILKKPLILPWAMIESTVRKFFS